MQMIIEARLVDDVQETARIQLAVIDREMTTGVERTVGFTRSGLP